MTYTYDRDAFGRVRQVSVQEKPILKTKYDAQGLVIEKWTAARGLTKKVYDGNTGRLDRIYNSLGPTVPFVEFDNDALGRLSSKIYQNNTDSNGAPSLNFTVDYYPRFSLPRTVRSSPDPYLGASSDSYQWDLDYKSHWQLSFRRVTLGDLPQVPSPPARLRDCTFRESTGIPQKQRVR